MTVLDEQAYWAQHYTHAPPHIFYDDAEFAAIVRLLGGASLRGKQVLDVGCGQGVWTRNLARLGANVVPSDLAPSIVAAAVDAAQPHPAHGSAADMHRLPFADASFDAVFGSMVIHHAQDHAGFGREVARVLKPGGVAVFHENAGRNPLLMLARRTLTGRFGIPRNSSPGEQPLRDDEIAAFEEAFGACRVEIARLYLMQLAVAYLLRHESGPIFDLARAVDRTLYRHLPRSRRWGYYQIVACTRL